jgi:hypothetical protein
LRFQGAFAGLFGGRRSRYVFEVRVALGLLVLTFAACGCTTPRSEPGEAPARTSSVSTPRASSAASGDAPLPAYLSRLEKLDQAYERAGAQIVPLPLADLVALRAYPRLAESAKGVAFGPARERLTLTSAKTTYAPDEDIRVLHLHEVGGPGLEVYVMGPKAIYGEVVDGVPRGRPGPPPVEAYDGAVVPSPGVDTNYEPTVYRLPRGKHTIVWRSTTLSSTTMLTSNTLTIEVR